MLPPPGPCRQGRSTPCRLLPHRTAWQGLQTQFICALARDRVAGAAVQGQGFLAGGRIQNGAQELGVLRGKGRVPAIRLANWGCPQEKLAGTFPPSRGWGWLVMGEPGREEYKIQSFDVETQQLLKTALKDPGAVDLEKVANVIVDQSLQDCVFSKEAGRMCYAIIQAREQLRARSLQGWVCYVTFICNVFDYLRVNNMPMMALVNPVYDCLFRLAQPDSLSKEEEVDCLVLQLHRVGEQLEKMNGQRMDELFVLIRDGFLLPTGLSSLAQLLLLEIIEFRAAGWKTTPAAHKYYYSEVSD
ncbi:MIF4G domain-containing protein [Tupaia chinensis]|uniref:MIF4G domain-containing protein n=1 Tax=Tupaia chinensis TaxID=246437 RepID=L9L0N1_TUPCH|nr:MIF4G domain-containing protein [Tupaia chinensis]